MNRSILISCLLMCLFLFGCLHKETVTDKQDHLSTEWQSILHTKLPLLGHRNWIVVTDMAYPLQAKKGITTLYANEPYIEVLNTVMKMLDNSTHVYAHTYQDKEFNFLEEDFCPGIVNLKDEMKQVLSRSEIISIEHDHLLARLDSISNLFEVIIIKTGLTKPYTSTFFELDCKYWDTSKQSRLNKRMIETKSVI